MVGGAGMIIVKIFHHMFVYVYVWVCVWIRTERLEAFMTKIWKIERKMNGKMHNHNNANTLENSRIAVYFSLPINNFLPFFLVNNVWFCVCAYMFEVEVVSGCWKKTQIWKKVLNLECVSFYTYAFCGYCCGCCYYFCQMITSWACLCRAVFISRYIYV